MSSVLPSSASVSQDGWLSDDEPPKDHIGDLHPLQLDKRGGLTTVKQIVALGSTIPMAFSPLDFLTVKYRNITLEDKCLDRIAIDSCNETAFQMAIEVSENRELVVPLSQFKEICPLGCEALKYMRVGETCIVWTNAAKGLESAEIIQHKRLSRLLQSMRRKFARANAEGMAWTLLGSDFRNYRPSSIVQLLDVMHRVEIGKFTKTVLKKSSSWQTPSNNAKLTLKIHSDGLISFRQVVISDLKSPSWKDLIRSIRLGEEIRIEFIPSDSDPDDSIFVQKQPPSDELHKICVTIELTEISTMQQFEIPKFGPNAGSLNPVDHNVSTVDSPCADESCVSHLQLETIQTLESAYHDECFRTYGGSDLLKTGDFIILALLSDHPEGAPIRHVALHVSRSKQAPEWFHLLLKHCRFGVKYRLHLKSSEYNVTRKCPSGKLPSASPSQHSLELLMEQFKTKEHTFFFRKLLGREDKPVYIPLQKHLIYNLKLPEDALRFEKEGSFSSDCLISWDSILPPNQLESKLTFIPIAQCGQELNAWQSVPSAAMSHFISLLSETARTIFDGELLSRCNNWSLDCMTYMNQLSNRSVDEQERDDVSSMALPLDRLASVSTGHTLKDLIPNTFSPLVLILVYLRMSVCYMVEGWKDLLSVLKTNNVLDAPLLQQREAFDFMKCKDIILSIVSMKARAEFALGMYSECQRTCREWSHYNLVELAKLGKIAAAKESEQHNVEKELYARMFK